MAQTIRVLGLPRPEHWRVSGLPADPAQARESVRRRFDPWRLTDVGGGLHIARPATSTEQPPRVGPELHVVTASGPDAGRLCPLPPTGLRVGRGSSDLLLTDPAASARPVLLSVTPTGIRVERPAEAGRDSACEDWDGTAPLRVGASALELVRGRQGPLAALSAPADAVVEQGEAPGDHSMLVPVLTAAAPLLLGVVLAVTTGSPLFLLLSLVSALASAAMLLGQRRRRRQHASLLTGRAQETATRRRAAAPGPAEVARACRARCDDRFGLGGAQPDAPLALVWGEGRGPFPLSRPDPTRRWEAAVTVDQPALTTPSPDVPSVVTGPPSALAGVTRWVLFQALRHAVATGTGLVETSPDGSLRRWWPGQASAADTVLAVADPSVLADAHEHWTAEVGGLHGSASSGPGSAPRSAPGVLIGTSTAGEGQDHVDLASGAVATAADARTVADVVPTGLAPATLRWWLAELALEAHRIGRVPGGESASPLRLPEAVGTARAVDGVRTQLVPARGADDTGAVALDLAADGPHALIAGTTGSGKSDLLTSVLTGLTAHHPPSEVALILLDFKGGASFGPFAALPHTMSLETNHVGAASLRALQAIRSELRRREALFAAAGVPDYPAYRRARPQAVLPRLVVAVDELRVLMDEHPDAAAVLQHLAATGRSLGFHLLLATQRATGTVSGDIRSNLGATIALRTATEQESWDLIGSAAAHRLDPSRPGSAILARPGRPDVAFRAAQWILDTGRPVWRRAGDPTPAPAGTPWSMLLEELARRCAEAALTPPEPVVSPALPPVWTAPETTAGRDPVLALLDDAARARHVPWAWAVGPEGGTAWIVEPGGGRRAVAEAVATAASRAGGSVLLLDGTGELTTEDSTDVVRLAPGDDAALGERVMDAVRTTAAAGGTLLVSGWASWSALRVGDTYRSLEEELHRWLSSADARPLRVGAVGGRDLATSRLLLHLPHRFHVPAGTSPEHRLVWPRLTPVESLPGRAVHVGPGHPEPGVPAQLAVRAGAPVATSVPPSTL